MKIDTSARITRSMNLVCVLLSAGVLALAAGCDDSSKSTDNGASSLAPKQGIIAENHGHTVTVTPAQMTSGDAQTLDLTWAAGHAHTVRFSVTELVEIEGGGSATERSSTEIGHSHLVTFQ